MSFVVGQHTVAAGTGNQSISTPGITPGIIILWTTGQTADGISAGARLTFGISDASTDIAQGYRTRDAQGTMDERGPWDHTGVAQRLIDHANDTDDFVASISAFAAGSATLNVATEESGALVQYLAIDASYLSGIDLRKIDTPGGAGDVVTSGLGFQPDSLIVFSCGSNVDPNLVASVTPSWGATDGTTEKCVRLWGDDASADSETTSGLKTLLCNPTQGPTAKRFEATLGSLDADGHTITFDTHSIVRFLGVLALASAKQIKVITGTQPAANGNSDYSVGFTPGAALFFSAGKTVSETPSDHGDVCFGAWTGSANVCAGTVSETGQATSDCDSYTAGDECIQFYDHAQTLVGEASASANGTNLRLAWSSVDGTQREFMAIVFEAAASGAASGARMMPGCAV